MTTAIEVKVLRSRKRGETYLYLAAETDYNSLPDALQQQFGEAEEFLRFELSEQRHLAIADTKTVLSALAEQGFYLQMPVDPVLINQMIQE